MPTTNETATRPIPTPCPLARDADGQPIDLPDGAIAWRVRRKTGGRPRSVLGVDKQPMQLPLGYTVVDLEDILAPAEYLLDVVDQKGEPLGLTVAIAIGLPRNAAGDDAADEPATIAAMLPTAGSETRLVLEANVRSTQMAFQHNQKTLELGLRMAETLRDGVRVMAESQADWIKSVSSARGFFRNAPSAPLPAPPPEPDRDDDDEQEEDDEPEAEEHWVDKLMPHVVPLIQLVVPMMTARFTRPPKTDGQPEVKLELADLFDWRRAEKKRNAAAAAAKPAPADPMSLLATLPPATVQKMIEVRAMLTPDETQAVMQLLCAFEPEDLPAVVAHIDSMSVEQVAEFLRAQISAKPAA